MKKGEVFEGIIEKTEFPNKGILHIEDRKILIKNTLPGQKIRFSVFKIRKDRAEGRILEIIEKSSTETVQDVCQHFGSCGGCLYRTLPYDQQLKLKETQVKELLEAVVPNLDFEGISGSPCECGYRNKMEFSFGDEFKDGRWRWACINGEAFMIS